VKENLLSGRRSHCWIEDFTAFTQRQWQDFTYKLSDGECLQEVQNRNVSALQAVLEKYAGKNIVNGTALSAMINYYAPSFGYNDFEKIRNVMPWIVAFIFDDSKNCMEIKKYNLLDKGDIESIRDKSSGA
jgi:2,3-bisphosphoglycerate-dependent phosphoglycerate mutase